MIRLISRQSGGLAALKLTKLFGIDDFSAAKDSGNVLIIIIYCYLIIIIIIINRIFLFQHRRCHRKYRPPKLLINFRPNAGLLLTSVLTKFYSHKSPILDPSVYVHHI